MRRDTATLVKAVFATVLGVLSVSLVGFTEARAQGSPPVDQPFPAYNPYPPGILPADIQPELLRVRREIETIFGRYFAEWEALTPPTLTGQPPTLTGTGYEAVRILGGLLNFDETMSPFQNVACASCHMPYAGFSGPIPSVNLTMIAYPGSFRYRAGKRVAQRYTYSPRFPVLHLQVPPSKPTRERAGTFTGGNFWDGRSTGFLLQSPDSEQAQHPPVDTQEHMFADTACIAFRLTSAPYRSLFELVWGADFDIRWPANTAEICAIPGGARRFTTTTPINLSPTDRTKANNIYDHWGQSISFLESSNDISPFTSKVDATMANTYTYNSTEMAAVSLFGGKSNCNSCHLDGLSTKLLPSQTDTGTPANTQPLFTCFGYANLGLPLNPRDAFYYQTTPDRFGFTGNSLGFGYRDLGFGTFLRSGFGSAPNPNASMWLSFAPFEDGKMQTSTIRDVALTPLQCPTTEAGQFDANGNAVPYFQKEFFHNGYIKSLKQLVHFYNTRDAFPLPVPVTSGHCPAGTTEKVDCWPIPEVMNNIDMTVGNLQLTDAEENLIVLAMQLATDGFDPANPTVPGILYKNIDSFTGSLAGGQCKIGGDPRTQGNETLIPTPPLPPCAPEVCGIQPVPNPPVP